MFLSNIETQVQNICFECEQHWTEREKAEIKAGLVQEARSPENGEDESSPADADDRDEDKRPTHKVSSLHHLLGVACASTKPSKAQKMLEDVRYDGEVKTDRLRMATNSSDMGDSQTPKGSTPAASATIHWTASFQSLEFLSGLQMVIALVTGQTHVLNNWSNLGDSILSQPSTSAM